MQKNDFEIFKTGNPVWPVRLSSTPILLNWILKRLLSFFLVLTYWAVYVQLGASSCWLLQKYICMVEKKYNYVFLFFYSSTKKRRHWYLSTELYGDSKNRFCSSKIIISQTIKWFGVEPVTVISLMNLESKSAADWWVFKHFRSFWITNTDTCCSFSSLRTRYARIYNLAFWLNNWIHSLVSAVLQFKQFLLLFLKLSFFVSHTEIDNHAHVCCTPKSIWFPPLPIQDDIWGYNWRLSQEASQEESPLLEKPTMMFVERCFNVLFIFFGGKHVVYFFLGKAWQVF